MNDQEIPRLLDRIAAEVPVGPPPIDRLLPAGRRALRRRRARVVLGVAAGVAVLTGAGLVGGIGAPDGTRALPPPSAASQPSVGTPSAPSTAPHGPLPDGGMASCVEEYRPAAVEHRGFAFDGVVVSIGPSVTGGQPAGPQDLAGVTFEVREWFRGGSGPTITVDMQEPLGPGAISTTPSPSYGVGTRLLVSGESRWGGAPLEDPIAWPCGFTRYWDEATAASWR